MDCNNPVSELPQTNTRRGLEKVPEGPSRMKTRQGAGYRTRAKPLLSRCRFALAAIYRVVSGQTGGKTQIRR